MNKKNPSPDNYLERVPKHNTEIEYSVDDVGNVTLQMKNKGAFNKLAQLILKKPKISYIHLDEIGSCVWLLTDGKKNIAEVGSAVEERFGEKIFPLYERLSQYFNTLETHGFITFGW